MYKRQALDEPDDGGYAARDAYEPAYARKAVADRDERGKDCLLYTSILTRIQSTRASARTSPRIRRSPTMSKRHPKLRLYA